MKRIIVAITGASGAIYGIRALELLRAAGVETHLVVSPSGTRTIAEETDRSLEDVKALASEVHGFKDIGASIASGSFRVDGMLVAPCSVKTLAEIATGVTAPHSDAGHPRHDAAPNASGHESSASTTPSPSSSASVQSRIPSPSVSGTWLSGQPKHDPATVGQRSVSMGSPSPSASLPAGGTHSDDGHPMHAGSPATSGQRSPESTTPSPSVSRTAP